MTATLGCLRGTVFPRTQYYYSLSELLFFPPYYY